jgi:hypothetical protein
MRAGFGRMPVPGGLHVRPVHKRGELLVLASGGSADPAECRSEIPATEPGENLGVRLGTTYADAATTLQRLGLVSGTVTCSLG